MNATNKTRRSWVIFGTLAGIIALAITLKLVWFNKVVGVEIAVQETEKPDFSKALFSQKYPASEKFDDELKLLRFQGRLKTNDEIMIHHWTARAGQQLEVPRALLWCLLFQESRLNHLSGINSKMGIHGLGQFSYFGFYEVNRQTNHFNPETLKTMINLLGQDVRPVGPRKTDLYHPSSYYYIPTAITASAVYLSNRHTHLSRLLDKKKMPYDRELLWLHAAMAYNKGTRGVLSLWNQAQKTGGKSYLENVVSEKEAFFVFMADSNALEKSMAKIWSGKRAKLYAKELEIHMKNIRACAVNEGYGSAMEVKEDLES